MPDSESPLVNEFKYDFIKRRLAETVVGGPKLAACTRSTLGIHLSQGLLYTFPALLGLNFYALNNAGVLAEDTCTYCVGATMASFTLLVQLLACRSLTKSHSKIQIDDENNLEPSSCCSNATLQFVAPPKKFKLNVVLHALLSGLVCALAFRYTSPAVLSRLFVGGWVDYLFCLWGWLVVCNAQYSLTAAAPPEPVVFHPLDGFEVTSLMRGFYVLVFAVLHLVLWRSTLECWVAVDRWLHVVFGFLPLLWFMGILPPLDALFPWVGEQVCIYVFGGTAMASDLRLFISLSMSVSVVVALYFIPSFLPCLIVAAVSGYLFSLDLPKLTSLCTRRPDPNKPRRTNPSLAAASFYSLVFALAASVLVLCHMDRKNRKTHKLTDSFGYILLCLSAFNCVLSSVQQVYIVHGFFVNPIYPTENSHPTAFHRRIKPLNFLGYLRILLVFIGAPLVMISYLGIFVSPDDLATHDKILFSITLARAYRWVWQHTENALLEMTVVHYVNYFNPSLMAPYGLGAQLLVAAFVHNRLRQLWHKLHLVFIVLVTSVSLSKQRRRFSGLIALLNVVFLPVVLAIVVVTCVMSAPLLPLFTLPIFLVGFARPLRMWPGTFKQTVTLIGDTVYYKQLTPSLVGNLQRSHLLGNLGHVAPGDFFLIHFEDRMIFIVVLEKGFGYCTFGIKGLELQETSCHAVEATHLDMLITTAFDRERQSRRSAVCMNSEPFHVFHPLATLFLLAYSDTRNVLTGLIDSPDTLRLVAASYVKTLVWVLLRHFAGKCAQIKQPTDKLVPPDVVQPLEASLSKLPRAKHLSPVKTKKMSPKSAKSNKTLPTQTQTSVGWSDEDNEDPLGNDPRQVNALPGSRLGTTSVLFATHLPGTIEFGLPAVDTDDAVFSRKTVIEAAEGWSESGQKLAPPDEWMRLPLDKVVLGGLQRQFSVKWFRFVLKLVGGELKMDEKSCAELEADERLAKGYCDLILTCHAIVNGLVVKNETEEHLRPTHVYKTFNGEVVWSPHESWLVGKKELYALSMKAYGYATKLALDQIILGESSTDEELAEYLTEYDNSWHIGSDASSAWEENVLQEKPNLFSLGFNSIQRTFTSHLLTLQQLPVHVGRVNPEVVRGIWASLAFELLYLTNDDEERFSIQAHPIILRNVIVQAADPPLGYPIFLSGHISAGLGSLWSTDAQ